MYDVYMMNMLTCVDMKIDIDGYVMIWVAMMMRTVRRKRRI